MSIKEDLKHPYNIFGLIFLAILLIFFNPWTEGNKEEASEEEVAQSILFLISNMSGSESEKACVLLEDFKMRFHHLDDKFTEKAKQLEENFSCYEEE